MEMEKKQTVKLRRKKNYRKEYIEWLTVPGVLTI